MISRSGGRPRRLRRFTLSARLMLLPLLVLVPVFTPAPVLAQARPGPKVTLRVKEMPVVDLLRFLADFASLNLVAGDDVKGKVTVDLKNVHWHKAFEAVARTKNLWWALDDNVLLVMTPEARIRELEAKLAVTEAKGKLAPKKLRLLPVHYAKAADLLPSVKLILGEEAKVSVDARTNTLIILSP